MRTRWFVFILLIAFHLVPSISWGAELQMTAGANSTTYDEVPEAKTWGFSLRTQLNFTTADSGWILHYYGPGNGFSSGEFSAGYEWKTKDSLYLEGGLGLSHSAIFGPRPLVILGFGYRVSSNVFLDFPIMLTSAIAFLPYIGFSF